MEIYYTELQKVQEENCVTVFESKVAMKIFGPKTDEETGKLRKLHNEELHKLYHLPNIVRLITSGCMRWAEHAA
jgi:hypothetical protein